MKDQASSEWLSVFDERYDLPCSKYISNTAIPTLYTTTKEKIEKELKEVEYFADLWSSEGLVPYLSYTVHFINKSWELQNRCLQTVFVPQDHTVENLAEILTMTLELWELAQKQQLTLTTAKYFEVLKIFIGRNSPVLAIILIWQSQMLLKMTQG